MKKYAILLLLLALAGCATDRQYPSYTQEDSLYYGSAFADPHLRFTPGFDTGRGGLFLYGVYPWWTYDYYSPYYYPYRFTYYHPFYDPIWGPWAFAGWSPSWPYTMGYGGRYPWYGMAYRPWPVYLSPPVSPGGTQPPDAGGAGGAGGGWAIDDARRRAIDERALMRERMYRGYPYGGKAGAVPGAATTPGVKAMRNPGPASYKTFPSSRASSNSGFGSPALAAPPAGIPSPSPRGSAIMRSRSTNGNAQRDN